jgi:hypothetical protein
MEDLMNIEVAKVTKGNLYEVIGLLQLADSQDEFAIRAKAKLIGLVKGLEIVITNDEMEIPHYEAI